MNGTTAMIQFRKSLSPTIGAGLVMVLAVSGAPPKKQLPGIRVSENHRFLVEEGGKPFFYLGDAAWELFHRLDRKQAVEYLDNRSRLHFNVVQAVASTVFHLDETWGIGPDHPASLRRFLRERLLDHAPAAVSTNSTRRPPILTPNASVTPLFYTRPSHASSLLASGKTGISPSLTLIFAVFDDPLDARTADLDSICREQQVHDGAFQHVDDVPLRTLSLTVPVFLRVHEALVFVNEAAKRQATKATLEGPIGPSCRASALRRHRQATIFLDSEAADLGV